MRLANAAARAGWLLALAGVVSAPGAAPRLASAQVIGDAAGRYEPGSTPTSPTAVGLTVVARIDDDAYATDLLGLEPDRVPDAVLGTDPRHNLLALTPGGLLSLAPDGANAMRLTRTSWDAAGLSGASAQIVATVDDLGWTYVVEPVAGLLRLGVTADPVVLYSSETLAEAAHSPLPPGVVDVEPVGDHLYLAGGNSGLFDALRTGERVQRVYDVFMDAETHGLAGSEAGVRALSRTPRGELLLAIAAGGQTYLAVLTEAGLRPVGDGPLVDSEVVPGGLAMLGAGAFVVVTADGLRWVNLAASRAELLGAEQVGQALRAVGHAGGPGATPAAALDGCGGQAGLLTSEAILTVSATSRGVEPGDVLAMLPDQQAIVRLLAGRDPVQFWEGDPLVAPSDAAVDAQGRVWVVDEGADTVFRFQADGLDFERLRADQGSPRSLRFEPDGTPLLLDLSLQDETGAQLPGVIRLTADGGDAEVVARGAPLQAPTDLAVDAEGRIYVADSAANRVWVIDPDEPEAGPQEHAAVDAPRALEAGPDGVLYVLTRPDTSQAGVMIVDAEGGVRPAWVGEPLVQPSGLVLEPDGSLLVADARADPFPSVPAGSLDTAGVFRLRLDGSPPQVALDSWLLRRNVPGVRLRAVPGTRAPGCHLPPWIRPPSRDPRLLPEPSDDDEGGGCSLSPARSLGSRAASTLWGLLARSR